MMGLGWQKGYGCRLLRALGVAALVLMAMPAGAQTYSRTVAPSDGTAAPSPALSEQTAAASPAAQAANSGRVGIMTGSVSGTYVQIGADLAAVLDDPGRLRVVPMVGKGSVQNVNDILYLEGVDIGIVQSDVLTYMERQGIDPAIKRKIRYISKLYNEEVHILARKDIATLKDLAGRKVNTGGAGGGSALTASVLFELLKIKPILDTGPSDAALQRLKKGEIDALVFVAGKPARLFSDPQIAAFAHFLDVDYAPQVLDQYLPADLTPRDYPGVVPDGRGVRTVAVGAVMAVYDWPAKSERYRKVETFIAGFFSNFIALQQPPYHAKWREVTLTAQVPGWQRFTPAQDWLSATKPGDLPDAARFERFLRDTGRQDLPDGDRRKLFEEFSRWNAGQR